MPQDARNASPAAHQSLAAGEDAPVMRFMRAGQQQL